MRLQGRRGAVAPVGLVIGGIAFAARIGTLDEVVVVRLPAVVAVASIAADIVGQLLVDGACAVR